MRWTLLVPIASFVACSDFHQTPPNDPAVSFTAAEDLQRQIAANPKDVVAHAKLSQLYLTFGYAQSAVEHLKQCMTIQREHPECVYALATLFELDGTQQAVREARRAYKMFLAVAPNDPKANLVKSRIDQLDARLGPDTEAPPNFAGSQPATPPTLDPHGGGTGGGTNPIPGHDGSDSDEDVGELNEFGAAIGKAFAAVERNDPPAAEAAFREALKLRTDDPTALAGLAQALLAQKKNDEAVTVAESAVKADAKDPQALWTLGLVLLRTMKDPKRGVEMWDRLVKEDPEYAKRLGVPEQLENIHKMLNQQNVHDSPK